MPTKSDFYTSAEEMMGYQYPSDAYEKRQLITFLERWGDVDFKAFARILQEGAGEEKVFAIIALRYNMTPFVHELLLPFLQSPQPMSAGQGARAACAPCPHTDAHRVSSSSSTIPV